MNVIVPGGIKSTDTLETLAERNAFIILGALEKHDSSLLVYFPEIREIYTGTSYQTVRAEAKRDLKEIRLSKIAIHIALQKPEIIDRATFMDRYSKKQEEIMLARWAQKNEHVKQYADFVFLDLIPVEPRTENVQNRNCMPAEDRAYAFYRERSSPISHRLGKPAISLSRVSLEVV